jgi:hypothetical protein
MCENNRREKGSKGTSFKDSGCVCVCAVIFQDAGPMLTNDAPIANDDPDVVWCVCTCRDKVYGACVSL